MKQWLPWTSFGKPTCWGGSWRARLWVGLWVGCLTLTLASAASARSLHSSGLHLNEAQQQALRHLVEVDAEAAQHFEPIRHEADQALSLEPRPLEVLHYGGLLDNNPLRVDTQKSLDTINSLTPLMWAWIVTQDERYAKHAMAHVLAWTRLYNPTGHPINEHKFEPLWQAYGLFAERFEPEDREVVKRWFDDMTQKQIASVETWPFSIENNWHPKRLKIVAAAGLILDSRKYLDYVEKELVQYLDRSLYGDGTTFDFHERDSLGYHSGGLRPTLHLLTTLGRDDLYARENEAGGSVRRSVHFLVPFVLGEKEHQEFLNTTVELDARRAEAGIARFQPGRLYEPRRALSLFEEASLYDPEIGGLIPGILGVQADRFATWHMVVNEARLRPQEPKLGR
jgi:hypothetical protein